MNGTELFNLTRRQLEQYCGSSEGSRLNGQLTLARNESGVSGGLICGNRRQNRDELAHFLRISVSVHFAMNCIFILETIGRSYIFFYFLPVAFFLIASFLSIF